MSKRTLIASLFVLLFILHQDFWWKNDARLVLGVLPVSLAYHVVWTLLVAFGWFLVVKFCWPVDLDEKPGEGVDRTKVPTPAAAGPSKRS